MQASRYKIQELIDTQGAVSTYQALDTLSNQPVLYYQYIAEPIDNAVQILSDNIPDILNVDFISGVTHVVTEFPPAKQRLKERLSDSQLEQFLLDTAQALEDASDAGVIHGDIRPERLLFDGNRYLIEGYGIRWEYMPSRFSAPEKKQSAAGDIYSWAKTVGAFIPFSVPKTIAELLERCLAKDPKTRPLPEDIVDELSTFFLQASQNPKHPTLLNLKQTIADAQPDLLDNLFSKGMSEILTNTQERFIDSDFAVKPAEVEASVVLKATTDNLEDDSGKLSTADLASVNFEAASELRNSQADISGQSTESLPEVSSSARITDANNTPLDNQSISNEDSLIAFKATEEDASTSKKINTINTDAPELDTIDQGLAVIANADTVEDADNPFLSKENFADLHTQGAVEVVELTSQDSSQTATIDSVELDSSITTTVESFDVVTDELVNQEQPSAPEISVPELSVAADNDLAEDTEITGLEAIEHKATYHDLNSVDVEVPTADTESAATNAEFDLVDVEADVLESTLEEIAESEAPESKVIEASKDLDQTEALDLESQAIENIFAEETKTQDTGAGFDVSDLDFSGKGFEAQENNAVADGAKNIGTSNVSDADASQVETTDFDTTVFDHSNFDANATAAGLLKEDISVVQSVQAEPVEAISIQEDTPVTENNVDAPTTVEAQDSSAIAVEATNFEDKPESNSTAFSVDELDFNDFANSKTQTGLDTIATEEQAHLQALQDVFAESDDSKSSVVTSIDTSDLMPHSTQLERAFEALSKTMYEETPVEDLSLTKANEDLLVETLSGVQEPLASTSETDSISETDNVPETASTSEVDSLSNVDSKPEAASNLEETSAPKSELDLSASFPELTGEPVLENRSDAESKSTEFDILATDEPELVDEQTQEDEADNAITAVNFNILDPNFGKATEGLALNNKLKDPTKATDFRIADTDFVDINGTSAEEFSLLDTDFVALTDKATQEVSTDDANSPLLSMDDTQEVVIVSEEEDLVPVVESKPEPQVSQKPQDVVASERSVFETGIEDIDSAASNYATQFDAYQSAPDNVGQEPETETKSRTEKSNRADESSLASDVSSDAASDISSDISTEMSASEIQDIDNLASLAGAEAPEAVAKEDTKQTYDIDDTVDLGLTSFLEDVLDNKNDSLLVQNSLPDVQDKQSNLTLFPMYEQETMFAKDTVMLKDAKDTGFSSETGIFSNTSFGQEEHEADPVIDADNAIDEDVQFIELTDFGGSVDSAASVNDDEDDPDKARAIRQAKRAKRRAEAQAAAEEEEIDVFKTAFGKIAKMEASVDPSLTAAYVQEELVKKTVGDMLSSSPVNNGASISPTVVDESKLTVFEAKHLSIAEKIAAKKARSNTNTQQQYTLKQTELGRGSRQVGQGPDVFGEDNYDAIGKLPADTEVMEDLAKSPRLTFFETPQIDDDLLEAEEAPKEVKSKKAKPKKAKQKGLFAKRKPKQEKAKAQKLEEKNIFDSDPNADELKITAERQEEFNKALTTNPLRNAWRIGGASLVLLGTAAIVFLALPGLKSAQSSFVEQASRNEASTIVGLNSDHVIYTQVSPAYIEDMISVVVIQSPEGSKYPPEYVFDIFPNAPLSLDVKGEWILQAKYQRSWSNLITLEVPNLGGEAISFNFNVQ